MKFQFSTVKKLLGFDPIRFIKFGLVGGSGIVVDMGLLWLFTELIGLHYVLSGILAFTAAVVNNFIWNDLWTWSDRGDSGIDAYLVRLIKFFLVSSIAGVVKIAILWLLTHFFNLYYLLSNLVGIAVGMILNFSINNLWTFKVRVKQGSDKPIIEYPDTK